MWLLIQENKKGTKEKFIMSYKYDELIKYINKFKNIKKIDDYTFIYDEEEYIKFIIHLGEKIGGSFNDKY